MMTIDAVHTQRIQLSGGWQARPVPLDEHIHPDNLSFRGALTIPDAVHLQPTLYPDRPYWGPHLRAINEQAWLYRRSFTLPDGTAHTRARLHFAGVDYFASVWLNGHWLGRHEGNFAPFSFDVTRLLRRGENELLVRVASPWDPPNPGGSYPTDHVLRGLVKGLYEHGEGLIPPNINPIGIWRPVYLLLDQGISIDRVSIRAGMDGQAALCLSITNATGQAWSGMLHLSISPENHEGPPAAAVATLQLPAGRREIEHTLQVPEAQLWWPWDHGEARLYRLDACLREASGRVLDMQTETFGFRSVRLERSPEQFTFYINNRPVFLRGSSYIPALYLSQCTPEGLARDIDLARGAGLNLLRAHVHVSPAEFYDLCDRRGMLVWQDFELNWAHDASAAFEQRARDLQREMISLLYNHPSIITWSCHNEPTMIFTRRDNLEKHPDPALYADAIRQDPTRPVFICSGQMEHDWQRAGDVHTYYGAFWTTRYTDVYRHRSRLNTEFGFEAPAHPDTLRPYPDCWERLGHLEEQTEDLWAYQAELVRFHVEHYRRLRAAGCAGYIHFWLADLVPQVGCGVLDAQRRPKGGYAALREASRPLQVALEHDGRRLYALWVFNDTTTAHPGARLCWTVRDAQGQLVSEGHIQHDVTANSSCPVMDVPWPAARCAQVSLALHGADGAILAENHYHNPLNTLRRPQGYPWQFDMYLGVKVFNRPGAVSLADQTAHPLVKRIPLPLRERAAEWGLRQRLPHWLVRAIARLAG